MAKTIIIFLSVLLSLSPVFARAGNDEGIKGAEAFLLSDRATVRISFEHYKLLEGWTPVVLSMGEFNCLLWMDETGRVSELLEADANFVELVCVIDVANNRLRKGADVLHFDVYEQNNIRTRWRLSSKDMAGTVTKKIIFREKSGIDLCLGNLRMQLKHVACDFKEISPGIYHVQFYGPMMVGYQPLVYEKAAGMIYSKHEWDNKLTLEQNRTQTKNPGVLTAAAIPAQERAALIALYNSTDGDNWTYNSGWKTPPLDVDGFSLPGSENNWCGISCNNKMVLGIYLGSNNLNGALPPELGNLANLSYLHLYSNKLSGTIPPELGNLANLKILILSGNQLGGSIPPELGNLVNLLYLSLGWNQLSGSIPPELGNLANLQYLDVYGDQLSSIIPKELGNLANLQRLDLYLNQFSGSIPEELGNLANLEYLDLGRNQLSGSIPPELGNLTNLQELRFYGDQLSGSIPKELGNLANLKTLALSSNQLSGVIPPQLGNLANLQWLYLSDNQLSGIIPPELGNLANLQGFYLNSNQLSSSIPSNLTHLTKLYEDFGIDFCWNALYTHDDILRDFLNSKQNGGNWESTQTIAPANVTATPVSSTSIAINWTSITYTSDSGGYRVFYSTTSGGPYTYFGMTAEKTASSLIVTGLNPDITYYFVVQTRTNPHGDNQNVVDSEYSAEVSAITSPLILTSPNGGESWGLNTKRNITWTYSGLSGNSNIRLELWKANKKLGNIVASFPIVNGNYDWTVGYYGTGIASIGNDYTVKIITTDGLYNDTSNAAFSIIRPSLTLTSPRGSESWKLGTLQNITWTSNGLTGNVKFLLFKNGVQVGVIARGIPITDGTYAWTVGKSSSGMAPKGSNYTVKIRSEDDPFYSSGSGPFKIW